MYNCPESSIVTAVGVLISLRVPILDGSIESPAVPLPTTVVTVETPGSIFLTTWFPASATYTKPVLSTVTSSGVVNSASLPIPS
jgi:hypothetical protein